MKRHLNTLYVQTQGAYLGARGETVKVQVEGETRLRVPIHLIGSVVLFGRVSCSPALLALCAERGVSVAFLSEHGRFRCRVEGPVSGNVLLRREQYRRSDEPRATAELARAVVLGKIANSRTVVQRALRDQAADDASLQAVAERLAALARQVQLRDLDVDSIRGLEGEAARSYFSIFDNLIKAKKEDFFFHRRSRRPPLDRVNAVLSFLYTLLLHDVASAAEATGLDPQVGFLHRERPGRPSLALDLMEELRPVLADRVALTLINQRQLKARDFRQEASGAVWLEEKGRRTVLEAYQQRKQDELRHPFLEEKMSLGLVPFVQARLLARCLRGELDGYPPFVWR